HGGQDPQDGVHWSSSIRLPQPVGARHGHDGHRSRKVTTMDLDAGLAEEFEQERGRLVALSYRMLGSTADAEDAVQEVWLRLARQDAHTLDNLPGWLTTVTGRVCLDMLRSRRTKAETAFDERVPDFVITADEGGGPEDTAMLADSVGLAMLVVLETLGPDERL